jgi:hypothetical protein
MIQINVYVNFNILIAVQCFTYVLDKQWWEREDNVVDMK